MKKHSRHRWIDYILVFIFLLILWTSLIAATSQKTHYNITSFDPAQELLQSGHPIFGITIGAIILVTIIITSAIFRKVEPS